MASEDQAAKSSLAILEQYKSRVEIRMYETTYIITPELTPDEFNAIIEKFNKIIKDGGGEFINQEVWGFRKLAYPIDKKQSGYYVFVEHKSPVTIIPKLEREFGYDERILRELTCKLEKDALAWNVKRRDRLQNKISEESK